VKIEITDITSINLSIYDETFAEKTIHGRMDVTNCHSVHDYIEFLKHNNSESSKLKKALNINYSEFFRNTLTFAFLEHHILPTLIKEKIKSRRREIRIWSAACASGQEAYSIAILCNEFSKRLNDDISFRIFATDAAKTEIQKAQTGAYPEFTLRNVTFERINSCFFKTGDSYLIKPQLKEYIDFSIFDLLNEECLCPPASIFGNFDVVFCANLLFYYTPEVQKRILDKVDNCITKNGWLIVGDAEKKIVEINKDYFSYNHLPVLQKRGRIKKGDVI